MAPPLKFPNLDPALVVPGAKFLKNSAPFRGKGVYVVVDLIEQVTDSQGTRQRVHYHNLETDRRGSMMLEDFCLGVEHLLPPEEPKVEPAPPAPPEQVPFDLEYEVRVLRSQNAEILALLSRVLRALPQQLPLIGT